MDEKMLNLIVNLHDGESAGAADGEADNGNDGAFKNISYETRARAEKLGIGDDLIEDYNNAFGKQNNSDVKGENSNIEESEESKDSNDYYAEFDSLIKGKYKDAYHSKMESAVKSRMSTKDRQITDMQKRKEKTDKILSLISNKYKDIKSDDLDALYNAVSTDNDLFSEKALENGVTAEEARNNFFIEQKSAEQQEELESLRREKAVRELDTHLRTLAVETQKEFPSFDLESEFANPAFRSALDFIAQRRNEHNEKTGSNDEIYDLTEAYKMAHWEEIQRDLVKRSSSAAISAVSQSIQSGAHRPIESAAKGSNTTSKRKSVSEMTDAEFDTFYENVKNGKAHI